MTQNLITSLEKFEPFNEQETKDKELILSLLQSEENIFLRSNLTAHMTSSAWVVNKKRDKVLMAYHNIYDTWAWLGGHADGEKDLLTVALKEVQEESSLTDIRPVSTDIFSVEVLTVDGHIKKGEYVSSHLHLNITYLIEADETQLIQIKADENSQIGWFLLDDGVQASNEKWFRDNVYSKLNQKLRLQKTEA
ncbi:NUDIX hydrolase [Vagococcus fluvialis]|uniref:NUDIX hydrolase n=1 Tax=Vagococcus fluvialis TaxID=2738 RepID=UPI003B5B5B13